MTSDPMRDAVATLRTERPFAWRLALVASFAAQVDHGLLRRLRLRFVAEADAGTEADLWFSRLVRFRNCDGIVLWPEAANLLRVDLRAAGDLFDAAWDETERAHRHLPVALRLEEELGYRLLRDDAASRRRIRVLLRAAVTALVAGRDEGLAHWAARALPRFPPALFDGFEEARMLHAGARARLDESLAAVLTPGQDVPDWLGWVAPAPSDRVRVAVRLSAAETTPAPAGTTPGVPGDAASAPRAILEVGSPDQLPDGHELRLVATDPLVLDVVPRRARGAAPGATAATIHMRFEPNEVVRAIVPRGALRLRTVLGEEYALEPGGVTAERTSRAIIDFREERARHQFYFGGSTFEGVFRELAGIGPELVARAQAALPRAVEPVLTAEAERGAWYVVSGPDGSGRTALLVEAVDRLERAGRCVPHHFCRHDVPGWADAELAVRSLCAQIEATYPHVTLEHEATSALVPARRLGALLARFSARRMPGDRLVLVVDGVDEIDAARRSVFDIIPERLPPGVAVLASARARHDLTGWPQASQVLLDDPRGRALRESAIRELLRARAARAGDAAARACGGNWLFAVMLAEWLGTWGTESEVADIRPGDVRALVHRIVRQLYGLAGGQALLAVALVAVAREPLPVDLFGRVAGPMSKLGSPPEPGPALSPLILRMRAPDGDYDALVPRSDSLRAAVLEAAGSWWAGQRAPAQARVGGPAPAGAGAPDWMRDVHARLLQQRDAWPEPFARRQRLFHAVGAVDERLVRHLVSDVEGLTRRCREDGVAALLDDLRLAGEAFPHLVDASLAAARLVPSVATAGSVGPEIAAADALPWATHIVAEAHGSARLETASQAERAAGRTAGGTPSGRRASTRMPPHTPAAVKGKQPRFKH
jgi:hypothetical protein